MSTSTSPPPISPGQGRSPLTTGLSVLAILAALGIGGYIVWSFWQGLQIAGAGAVVTLDEPPSEYFRNVQQERIRMRAEARERDRLAAPDFVRERDRGQGGGWEVKGNRTQLVIQRAGGNLRLRAESLDPNFLTAEQRQILTLRFRAVAEDGVARQLNLTDQQREQLRGIPRATSFPIDDATRANLEALFLAWEQAPADARQPAADALIAAVRALEAAQEGPTRQAVNQRVAEIRAIVSPEQIAAFEQMVRGR